MANDYNAICQSSDAKLGFVDCSPEMEQLSMVLFMDETKSFDLTSYATNALYLAALQTSTLAVGTARTRPLPIKIGANFSNSADPSPVNGGYNGVYSVINGKPVLEIELGKNGIYQMAQLYMLSQSGTLAAQLFDKAGRIWGRGANAAFKGFKIDAIEVMKLETPAGTTNTPKKVRIHFTDENMFLEGLNFYQFARPFYPQDNLFAIKPVELELVSASASAVVVKARLQGSRKSMGVDYETGLELPAAWSFVKASDGTAQTIASVTYSATAETFTLGTSGFVTGTLNLVSAVALAALASPVGAAATGGFEATSIAVTI